MNNNETSKLSIAHDEGQAPQKEASWFMGVIDTALSHQAIEEYSENGGELEGAKLRRTFPRHEVERLIGKGGYGTVYLVHSKTTHERYAAKFIPAHVLERFSFKERLLREYQILKNLNHPGIVKVYDLDFLPDGSAILFMEYVEGEELKKNLSDYSVRKSLETTKTLAGIVDYMHSHGVSHRDLKPANILIRKDGAVKVVDFGLAQQHATANVDIEHADYFTADNERMGTPVYSAPELSEAGSPVAHSSDIYSLGVILYEMLMGTMPVGAFHYPSREGIGNKKVDQLINKSLKKDPIERHQSANSFERELDVILKANFTQKPSRSSVWKWLAAASVVACGVGFALYGYIPAKPPQEVRIYRTDQPYGAVVTNWMNGSEEASDSEREFYKSHINSLIASLRKNDSSPDKGVSVEYPEQSKNARELSMIVSGGEDNSQVTDYLIKDLQNTWQEDYRHTEAEYVFLKNNDQSTLDDEERLAAGKVLQDVLTESELRNRVQAELKKYSADSPVSSQLLKGEDFTLRTLAAHKDQALQINTSIVSLVENYLEEKVKSYEDQVVRDQQKMLDIHEEVKSVDALIRDTPWALQMYNVFSIGLGKEQESIAVRAVFTGRHINKVMEVNLNLIKESLEQGKMTLAEAKTQYFRMREYLGGLLLMNHRNIILAQNSPNPFGATLEINAYSKEDFLVFLSEQQVKFDQERRWYDQHFIEKGKSTHQKIKNRPLFSKLLIKLRAQISQVKTLRERSVKLGDSIALAIANKNILIDVLEDFKSAKQNLIKVPAPAIHYMLASQAEISQSAFWLKHAGVLLAGILIALVFYHLFERNTVYEKSEYSA